MKKFLTFTAIVCVGILFGTQIYALGGEKKKSSVEDDQRTEEASSVFVNCSAAKERSIKIGGKVVKLKYKESYNDYVDSDEFDFVDSYESNEYSALYKGNTDDCIGFCRSAYAANESKTKINKKTAKMSADKYLREFVGNAVFSQYGFTNVWFNENENEYKITYIAKIKEYMTDDLSMVCIAGDGELISVSAIKHGKYKNAKWDKRLNKYESKVNKLITKNHKQFGDFSFLSEPFLSYDDGTRDLSFKQKDLKTNKIRKISLKDDEEESYAKQGRIVLSKKLKKDSQKVSFVLKGGSDDVLLKVAEISVVTKRDGKKHSKTFTKKGNNLKRFSIKYKLKDKQRVKAVKVRAGYIHVGSDIKGYSWETFDFKAVK